MSHDKALYKSTYTLLYFTFTLQTSSQRSIGSLDLYTYGQNNDDEDDDDDDDEMVMYVVSPVGPLGP